MENLFRTRPGVVDTEVGYQGGQNDNPTYGNHPGHAESIEIAEIAAIIINMNVWKRLKLAQSETPDLE